VTPNDYGLFANAFGELHPELQSGGVSEFGAVPEPATLGLMILGAVAMLARRRRAGR